jgi:hypothetical protein
VFLLLDEVEYTSIYRIRKIVAVDSSYSPKQQTKLIFEDAVFSVR